MNAKNCFAIVAAALVAVSGCSQEDEWLSGEGRGVAHAATVVDSIRPIEDEIAMFLENLPEPESLAGGSEDRDELVADFANAIIVADTAALASLLLDRAEFAYLYYPHTRYVAEPYELSPALVWFQTQNGTSRGITRALRRYGDQGLEYLGYSCGTEPTIEGPNKLWQNCLVSFSDESGDEFTKRLFGSIIERDGHFKFVSYTNDL